MVDRHKFSFQEQELAKMLQTFDHEFAEFDEMIEEAFPGYLDHLSEWWSPPQFITLVGDDRVCNLCGALIHAGARIHHVKWHKTVTLAISTLQGAFLSHLVKTGEIPLPESPSELDPEESPPKKKKKSKKTKKKGKNRAQ